MNIILRRIRSITPLTVILLSVFLVGPAAAQQLASERLAGLPAQLVQGSGTVRLDGMGGFQTAVYDQNLQLNANDFSLNPAGYGDDKNSWNTELRYGHREFNQVDPRTDGNDVFINEGAFVGGFHRPGRFGAGAEVNFAEVEARTSSFGDSRGSFDVLGLRLVGNTYVHPTLSLGADIIFSGEDEAVTTSSIYNINHTGSTVRGSLGALWTPVDGVSLGGKGQLISSSIDGVAEGDFHNDSFEWTRPGGQVSLQGFVDRGRVKVAVDFRHEQVDGSETVRISWSEKFIFNPGPEVVVQTLDTFSESRTTDVFRARAFLSVSPTVTVSAATTMGSEELGVRSNPNAIGSREAQDLKQDVASFVAGASWTLMEQRLLLAGEGAFGSSDSELFFREQMFMETVDSVVLRVGGEYFFGESVAGRAGLILDNRDLDLGEGHELNGSYATTRLAAGIGILPRGGIWQFDFALESVLTSDLDDGQSVFSAYLRRLF